MEMNIKEKSFLLIEVGTEEIPSGQIELATNWLATELARRLEELRLEPKGVHTYATPRRIAVVIDELLLRQPDRTLEVTGPPVKVAFDADGNPTKAAIGFAKKMGIPVEMLQRVQTKKGEVVMAIKPEVGMPAKDLLAELVPHLLGSIPWRKSMRWADIKQPFVRPIHWILALIGDVVIEFDFAGVRSGNKSFGHRFKAPEPFEVKNPQQYLEELKARYVVPQIEERKETIQSGMLKLANSLGAKLIEDEELLNEVANLVEYPLCALGEFEEKYLNLPRELLITVLRSHQKLFCFEDETGTLLPNFGAVLNVPESEHVPEIVRGNGRVVRARLADAEFVIEEDKQRPLADMAATLDRVTFQRDLGSIGEKVGRFTKIAEFLTKSLNLNVDAAKLNRASLLAKADLASMAVYEFPELQGIMGRYYAELQGEDEQVALAIESHWRPRFSGDEPPKDTLGALISIADKMDTIVGCFSVGIKPTGTKDAFALRRQAIGILQTSFANSFGMSLKQTIAFAFDMLGSRPKFSKEDTTKEVEEFFAARFEQLMVDSGIKRDVVQAVLNAGFDNPIEAKKKCEAVANFSKRADYEQLAVAFKRVGNILEKQAKEFLETNQIKADANLFLQPEERALFEAIESLRAGIETKIRESKFDEALEMLAEIKEPVDRFFDEVLVMHEDEQVKKNRLALLASLRALFADIADFRKISVK